MVAACDCALLNSWLAWPATYTEPALIRSDIRLALRQLALFKTLLHPLADFRSFGTTDLTHSAMDSRGELFGRI